MPNLTELFPAGLTNLTKTRVSSSQNIYEADFEYSLQPMRWEVFTTTGATITHVTTQGGALFNLTGASGALAIRQTRPYFRYQPGKTMRMASAMLFGTPVVNQRQRVGFFDDGNGVFFEQGDPTATNPSGMAVVVRSDAGGTGVVDTVIPSDAWSDSSLQLRNIDWSRIQMIWIEYSWYGAGVVRWGVEINGVAYTLHEMGFGNRIGKTTPWARTGNLPVRYELRNVGTSTPGTMSHYGVSVTVEGGADEQRGFTYGYSTRGAVNGNAITRALSATDKRLPLLSIRYRPMGTLEYGIDANYSGANGTLPASGEQIASATTSTITVNNNPWTPGQWVGKYVWFRQTANQSNGIGRIISNTSNTLTFIHNVTGASDIGMTPATGVNSTYIIGLINRGQILPQLLNIYSTQNCLLELICSRYDSPVTLTGSNFGTLYSLGSITSFAERDISATALTGGEVVYSAPLPVGGLQLYDLSNFFPLYNSIVGNVPDILTVAITGNGTNAPTVGASLVGQEAMS
jgi:hypothetical protein